MHSLTHTHTEVLSATNGEKSKLGGRATCIKKMAQEEGKGNRSLFPNYNPDLNQGPNRCYEHF